MTKDYPVGMFIRMLANGRRGEIKARISDTASHVSYEILFDGEEKTFTMSYDMIAPQDHPWHEQMKKWRAEGIEKGFSSIYIAIDEETKKYKAFFGNGIADYNKTVRAHPKLKFKYYWRLHD